ncbi:3-oxoacyl-ACP synthase III family protein [Aegicerativicinus sediminis]|uniref:3-oxoacyl-ACP synthase III family protein n=1 Tax=Aegicerativicinus sediminis TaxID=2893202 RepID=UPI001E3A33A9|nr:ketoacyl-ACP synthase III [Aegicerativicinus sediminis]
MGIKIIGSGSYIPSAVEKNEKFSDHEFFDSDGNQFSHGNEVIIEKFKAITGILERRYADPKLNSSDLGYLAARKAIDDAGVDPETIDYIIAAHNFGDVKHNTIQSDVLPCLAARIKHLLGINNPNCVAYDILFGCPGWVQGMIQAKAFIDAGIAKRCLVIGSETLSRVVDKHDRDSMIFSDGAGATIIEKIDGDSGILSHENASYTTEEAYYLYFGNSNKKELCRDTRYIKMDGRKIYEFALKYVPQAMKSCLDKSGKSIKDLKKIFLHQANEKMDEAILKRFYRLYRTEVPEHVMPMSIHELGNSSVATVPTLYDMVAKNTMENHRLEKGDVIMFASVGAGMHINAMVYEC